MRIRAEDLLNRKEITNMKGVNLLINGKSRSGKTHLANEIYNYYLKQEDFNPILLNGFSLEGFFGLSCVDSYTTCKIPTHSGQSISITKGNEKKPFFILPPTHQHLFIANKYLVKGRSLGASNNVLVIDDVHYLNTSTLLRLIEFLSAVYTKVPTLICIGNGRVYNGDDNLFTSLVYTKFPLKLKRFGLFPWKSSTFNKYHSKLEENYLKSFAVFPERQINLLPDETYKFIKRRRTGVKYDPGSLPTGLAKQYNLPVNDKDDDQCLYVSSLYSDVDSINGAFIEASRLHVYKETPDLTHFTTAEVKLLRTLCNRKIRTIELIDGCPVLFRNNDRIIYGIVTSVKETEGRINTVSVLSKNRTYHVARKEYRLNGSNKSFSYLPIELAWCVKLSLFDEEVFKCNSALVLHRGMRLFVFEEYINKTSNPRFVNTYFINQETFLKPNYIEFMSTPT